MQFPWANAILLILLVVQGISGYLGFTNGLQERHWFLWLHGVGGFGLVVVLFWKTRIILNVYRRGLDFDLRRLGFLFLALGLLVTVATGYSWTYLGSRSLLGVSLITWHIFLAAGILVIVAWHLWVMRYILRHPTNRGRSLFFRSGAILAGGFVLWGSGEWLRQKLPLPGAARRFTGSYQAGRAGQFPAYIWIADRPEPVQVETWRLAVRGELAQPLHLSYPDVQSMDKVEWEVILDCTGGWYTRQIWCGVRVRDLFELAGMGAAGRSVTFESVTGYQRRFATQEAAGFLLATGVAGGVLNHSHGYPLRLVAPGRRGFHWVKWVTAITVNPTGPIWQSPLPLQ